MKFAFFGIFILSASLFANEMCASLCKPCTENSTDSTCIRIDSLCHCNALLDSIERASLLEQQFKAQETEKLAQNIQDSCNTEFCAFQITFSDDTLSGFQKAKIPVSKKKLKSYKISPEDSSIKDSANSEPLLVLSDDCKNFCTFCPAEKSADSNCIRIENICGCTAFAEQELRLAEKAKADSIQKLQDFIQRNEQLKATADSIYSYSTATQDSSFFITLRKEDFLLIDIRKAEEKKPDTSTTTNAIISVPQDTTAKLSDSLRVLPKKETNKNDKPVSITANNTQDHWRVLYLGLSLHVGQIYDNGLAGKDVSRNGSIATGLGIFIRTYFYKYGSFQFGANAVYQYADYDILNLVGRYSDNDFDAGIQYHNLIAEFPLEFRFGFPTWKGFSPFFSYNFNIRKPIYAWYNWYVEGYGYTTDYYYKSYGDGWDSWDSSPYEAKDFEFTGYFGFGLEIFRHFSLEFQWLLHAISTYSDNTTKPYDTDDTWQIKLDIAF